MQGDKFGDDDSKSCQSTRSANIDRPYKPRPKTLAAYLLIALKTLAQEAYISQESVKQHLKNDQGQSTGLKPFALTVGNLAKAGYLEFEEEENSCSEIRLTAKGLN